MRRFTNYCGDTYHTKCPVCEGGAIYSVWKIPFGLHKDWILSYGSETYIEYYSCETCESIFRNPYDSEEHEKGARDFATGLSRVNGFTQGISEGYRDRYRWIAPIIPKESRVIVDAACGGAQYLQLIREDPAFRVEHLIGFELVPILVEYVHSLGFDSRQVDLKVPGFAPDLENKVDCVIFSEAFEHVIFPLRVLRYLVTLLKPGGMLWFSVQRVAIRLLIKMYEDYCLTQGGITVLAERLRCNIVSMDAVNDENPAWYVVFQKPEEQC